jgi:pyruvate/oxaloacetate carboxyltransferase
VITGFHHTLDQIDRQYICAEQFAKHVRAEIIAKQVNPGQISNLLTMLFSFHITNSL